MHSVFGLLSLLGFTDSMAAGGTLPPLKSATAHKQIATYYISGALCLHKKVQEKLPQRIKVNGGGSLLTYQTESDWLVGPSG